jgi:tRNA(fMet)-specific endonuclease VapC
VIAAISESELWVGVHRADDAARAARRRAWIEQLLEEVPVVPFDSDVARVHAGLAADLMSRGHRIGAHDLLVAATAVRHGAAVLTSNVSEFVRVPGLTVRMPTWPTP